MEHTQEYIEQLVRDHADFFAAGASLDVGFRKTQLLKLRRAIKRNETAVLRAIKADLGKAPFEAFETEIALVYDEITYMLRHLDSLATPKRVPTPLAHFPSKSSVHPQPYGVVLIMSPWNYPFLLTMAPLVGAIAAGNCAVVKPSAYAAETSALMARLLGEAFPGDYISVVEGGRRENQHLLECAFDYIFFTGSVEVGKLVMAAAAQHLTPVTLELGGKSPCIVDATANVRLAAKRIVWGKFVNAGQTCVAPDYVLAHSSVAARLVHWMEHYIDRFYGAAPHKNPDFPKIINQKHFERLCGLLDAGQVAIGGQRDPAALKIAPTVLWPATWGDAAMQEEIFGPVLPVLEFDALRDAAREIAARPKPLALYCFTNDERVKQWAKTRATFGGGCINDVLVHLATPHMPFGGVGQSGMGGYHGKASFNTFSHHKSILEKSNRLDLPVRYPPYNSLGLRLLRLLFR